MNKRPFTIYLLSAVLGFQSLGGIGGGLALTLSPSGAFMNMPLSALDGSPFKSFLLPGLILFLLLGVLPGILAYAVIKLPAWPRAGLLNIYKDIHWSWTYSLYTGIMLAIWIFVEIMWISYDILQTIYGLVGLLLVILTLMPANMRYVGWKS